jgi:hypothetical protein
LDLAGFVFFTTSSPESWRLISERFRGSCAANEFVGDALSQFIVIFARGDLLADVIQGSGHVGNRVLIEFRQHSQLSIVSGQYFRV